MSKVGRAIVGLFWLAAAGCGIWLLLQLVILQDWFRPVLVVVGLILALVFSLALLVILLALGCIAAANILGYEVDEQYGGLRKRVRR